MQSDNQQILLARTNLHIAFEKFLQVVEGLFPKLGKIEKHWPINEGYEDANFVLITKTGKYVLKIFSKGRTAENSRDYVRVLDESTKIKVPVTKLVEGNSGLLNSFDGVYFILTDFFEGEDFQKTTPTLEDISKVADYLAILNTLDFQVEESYDSWGNKNLLKEYSLSKEKITEAQNKLIEPIVEGLSNIDLTNFSKSVIHGDMQRKHVLKNKSGSYCILDFGCMAYGPKVIDFSTYLAWFCLQKDTWENMDTIYKTTLERYLKVHSLNASEIESLPLLTRASYAAYYLKTTVLINEGDTSVETGGVEQMV